jgi:hypothetical protein
MPKDVKYGGDKPEKESVKQAKGKNGSSLTNDLFASVGNLFYEFGLINKPSSRDDQKDNMGQEDNQTHQDQLVNQQDQNKSGDYDPSEYSDDEVLLSQYNKIGQQYWEDPSLAQGQKNKR